MTRFEIRNRWTGNIILSIETDTWKLAVEAAIKSYADLRSADLRYANLSYADLSSADLSSADLSSADLSSANLSYANLSYANLSYANLRSADLSSANLRYANLSYANLRSANLSSADLSSADLSYADLSSANLSYADLSSANLRYANLSSANLSSADLRYANLRYANLSYANLRSAKGIKKNICTPLMLLMEQVGKIRAYKLVTINGHGPYNGGIQYEVGKDYAVGHANIDDNEHCAKGINLATLDWCMKNWQMGYRILIAEFVREDIAAIPIATDGKFRVYRCRIVGEKDLTEIGLIEKEDKNVPS